LPDTVWALSKQPFQDLKCKMRNPRSQIRNLKCRFRHPQSAIRNALLLLLLLGTNSFAQTTAVVHLADGRTAQIVCDGAQFDLSDKGTIRGQAGGGRREFPSQDIWKIEFGSSPVARGSTEQLWLLDGTRLSGQLVGWEPWQRAVVRSDLFRSVPVWDSAILALTHGWPPPPRLPATVAGKDVLHTSDGDRRVGRFLRIDARSIGFRSELGNLAVERQRVSSLVLDTSKTVEARDAAWALVFANGDRVFTGSWAIEGGRIRCTICGNQPNAPASLLRRAIHLGPRTEVFSRIQPQQFSMQPLLEGTRAILVDRGPGNGPLLSGNREYLFGLFLRPNCEMDYALSGNAEFFLAELAPASDFGLPIADCGMTNRQPDPGNPQSAIRNPQSAIVRVALAVGDSPWKSYSIAAGDAPLSLAFPLDGARRLRLRVESANEWGDGAHVLLGEPVLIKKTKP